MSIELYEKIRQLEARVAALEGNPIHRCQQYWRTHDNRCVRDEHHEGECYFAAPASAISVEHAFQPPRRKPGPPKGYKRQPRQVAPNG